MSERGPGHAERVEERYLVFALGTDTFALPADRVRELLRPPALTRVPGAPAALAGLANLRGMPLPVLDLRRLLRPGHEPDPRPERVVVAEAGEPVGLLVDRVAALAVGTRPPDGRETGLEGADRLRLTHGGGSARIVDLAGLVATSFPPRAGRPRPVQAIAGPEAVTSADEAERAPLVSFTVSGRLYALPLEDVDEVVSLPADVVPVPRGAAAALGVVPHRGGVLPILSLATLLDLTRSVPAAAGRVVVARRPGGRVGLAVDALGPVLRLSPDAIDPVPSAFRRDGDTAVEAICRIDDGRALVSVLSIDRLLREDAVRAQVEDAARARVEPGSARDGADDERFVVFELAGESYGVPLGAVREILRVPDAVTRLPGSPDFVEGVINLRGDVIAVIDQRRRFGLERGRPDPRRRIVVVDAGGTRAGVLVDGASRILRVRRDEIRPAPDLMGGPGAAVDRVASLDGGLLLLVEPRALLEGIERGIVAAGAAAPEPDDAPAA